MACSLLHVTPMRWLLLLACGCGIGTGEIGDRGAVRFSLIHRFAAGSDLSPPIAVDRTVLVALQRPSGTTFTEVELRIEDPSGDEVNAFPLGFAQYALILEEPGAHRLIAVEEDGFIVDSLSIRAEEVDELEIEPTAKITTTRDDGTMRCTTIEDQPIKNVVLHQNQTLEMFVVPRSRDGERMIGLLALTAEGPSSVELSSPLPSEGAPANALAVDPIAEMDDTLKISVEEEDRRIETPIAATNEEKLIACES